MYEPGISVVVVNYNTPRLLSDFLDSYTFSGHKVDTELIIMDVDPTEFTQDAVAVILGELNIEYQYWHIPYNAGYSGACNMASESATKEVLAFFNSDTRLFDDTLDVCYEYLQSNPDVAICGPMQIDSNGLVTHAGIFGTNSNPQMRGWRSRKPSDFNDVRDDAVSVSGSAYFVVHEVWDEMANHPDFKALYPSCDGAMLPTPHYYEETWCSYFARHLGYKVGYVGNTMMIHEWHKSSPVGSVEGQVMRTSREMFRSACDALGIEHD